MKPKLRHFALLLAATALLMCAAARSEDAQPVKPPPPKPKPAIPEPAGEAAPVDPTQLSPNLARAVNPPAKVSPVAPAQVVEPPKPVAPDIVLKALIIVDGKPPAALIELDGKNQKLVSEGTQLSVTGSGDRPGVSLVVKKISAEGVEIEVVELKTVIHVK